MFSASKPCVLQRAPTQRLQPSFPALPLSGVDSEWCLGFDIPNTNLATKHTGMNPQTSGSCPSLSMSWILDCLMLGIKFHTVPPRRKDSIYSLRQVAWSLGTLRAAPEEKEGKLLQNTLYFRNLVKCCCKSELSWWDVTTTTTTLQPECWQGQWYYNL